MDLSKHFILLNGEPKTLQIDAIQRNGTNGYSVRFKNNGRTYNYGRDKVVWLNNPEWKDPTQCKVLVDGILKNGIREIWRFDDNGHSCWRVIYNNGFVQDDAAGRIVVTQSSLQEAVSQNVFSYMKNVATINTLGKDEQHPEGILSNIYNMVDFIADDLATACYLNPAQNKPRKLNLSDLIYPFGCNASQKIAVSKAFEHQISVIQGPPGTGKTQTILNIIANIVRQGKTVMVVSNNNSATANVQEKLEKYGIGFIAAALGSKDNKEHFITNRPALPSELGQWNCAKNAVIVGDTKQLPNVETEEDRMKLREIAKPYNIADGYDCAEYSFLESVLKVIPNVTETMLREHYRCHPRINQKFYGGNLLVMTEDKGEENVLSAFKTAKGNHAVGHFNQREIDVVKQEVLPTLTDAGSIGIVTPYNNQVDAFNLQLNHVTAGTIHKYQGREEDAIIMSVVDNQISEYADDAKMLNVAVSRAQKRFCLVVTGNEQEKHSNIMDLLDYIAYNNCTVTESKLASIFDYLYEQYTEQRMAFLGSHPQISEYASENQTYALIGDVLTSDAAYNCLKVLCHIPLRQVVKDTSMMSAEELKYASNYNTHLDFLIINRVSKQPVLAIETDGYSYHNDETEQHQRDLMKDHILSNYGLPLLRLSTKGSGERDKIINFLNTIVG